MHEDILGKLESEKTDEEIIEGIDDHEAWCFLYCIKTLNELIKIEVLSNGDGEMEEPVKITEKGQRLLDLYWKNRGKPTEEDMKIGMVLVRENGFLG